MQRDEAWFARRAGKWTASRAGDLMAKTKSGPSASRKNLIATLVCERITGRCVETYQNAAMLRGIELEAEALVAYSFETGFGIQSVDFVDHPTIPMCGCSPDSYVGEDGLAEVKCPSAMAKHLEALERGAHAQEYSCQLQHQLMVTNRAWVDAVSYHPDWPAHLQLAIVRVNRDESLIGELVGEIAKAEQEVSEIVQRLKARIAA